MGRKPSNCRQLRVLLSFLKMYMLQDQPWSICSPQRRSYLFLTLFLTGASFLKLVFFYLGFWCFSISMTMTLHSASHSLLYLHPKLSEISCHFLTVAQYFHISSQSGFLFIWNHSASFQISAIYLQGSN